jgi:hypothetical protein
MLIWEWADSETNDGDTKVTLPRFICHADNVTGVAGFGAAFAEVGWAVENGGGTRFPNFTRWNGETTKNRLQNAARQAKWRNKRYKNNDSNVISALPEKRREESIETTNVVSPTKPRTEKQVERDALWDVVVAEWKMPIGTKGQCARVGKLVGEFKGAGATPEEIPIRRKRIVDAWGPEKATPESVAKHWGQFDGTGPSQSRVGRAEAPPGKYDALMAKARAKSQSSGTELAFPVTGEEPNIGKD